MQYLLLPIAERYLLESDIPMFRAFLFSCHFRFTHQVQDATAGNGEIAELGEVGQCRCQRVEDAGADNQEHHEREQAQLSAYQQIRPAKNHQRQTGADQRDRQ